MNSVPEVLSLKSEALILGGGLAGASIATLLARAGRPITLIEQHATAHHKVCGEFLSHEALHYLTALGLNLPALGAAPIHSIRLATRAVVAEATLPFPALSLTRRRLDEALLTLAQRAGAELHRGHRIDSLTHTNNHWQATLASGETLQTPTVFLATGKHDLRAHPRPPGRQPNLIAFNQYFRLAPQQAAALTGHVELLLFPGGYAGLQPVEDGHANLCLLIHRDRYKQLGALWPNLIAHMTAASQHLAERLTAAAPILEKPLALSSIPYGYLCSPTDLDEPNLWRLGDQAAAIPSFSGDGMSIALHTAHLAASEYLAHRTSRDFTTQLHAQLYRQITTATYVSRALVHPASRPLIHLSACLFPTLLAKLANTTRIPANALIQP
jgi:flavin-dependent dehydrogenase